MIPTLPILATIVDAYVKVFKNAGVLLKATLIPGLVLAFLSAFQSMGSSFSIVSFVFWFLGLPFAVLIAMACHRVVLLGPDSLSNAWSFYWTDRESSFFAWLFILGVMTSLAALVFGVVFLMAPESVFGFRTPWLGTALTFVAVTYLEARFSMVLPATALDKRMHFSNSWYLTAGNGPRITIALLTPLVIFFGAYKFLIWSFAESPTATFGVLAITLAIITFAVEIAVLSLSYKFLRDASLSGK